MSFRRLLCTVRSSGKNYYLRQINEAERLSTITRAMWKFMNEIRTISFILKSNNDKLRRVEYNGDFNESFVIPQVHHLRRSDLLLIHQSTTDLLYYRLVLKQRPLKLVL